MKGNFIQRHRRLIVGVGGIFLVWLCFIPLLNLIIPIVRYYVPSFWQQHGLIGDTYGAFNALLSGFGLLAIAYSIRLQIIENRKAEKERNQRMRIDREVAIVNCLQTMIQAQETVLNTFKEQNKGILMPQPFAGNDPRMQKHQDAKRNLKNLEDEFLSLQGQVKECYKKLKESFDSD